MKRLLLVSLFWAISVSAQTNMTLLGSIHVKSLEHVYQVTDAIGKMADEPMLNMMVTNSANDWVRRNFGTVNPAKPFAFAMAMKKPFSFENCSRDLSAALNDFLRETCVFLLYCPIEGTAEDYIKSVGGTLQVDPSIYRSNQGWSFSVQPNGTAIWSSEPAIVAAAMQWKESCIKAELPEMVLEIVLEKGFFEQYSKLYKQSTQLNASENLLTKSMLASTFSIFGGLLKSEQFAEGILQCQQLQVEQGVQQLNQVHSYRMGVQLDYEKGLSIEFGLEMEPESDWVSVFASAPAITQETHSRVGKDAVVYGSKHVPQALQKDIQTRLRLLNQVLANSINDATTRDVVTNLVTQSQASLLTATGSSFWIDMDEQKRPVYVSILRGDSVEKIHENTKQTLQRLMALYNQNFPGQKHAKFDVQANRLTFDFDGLVQMLEEKEAVRLDAEGKAVLLSMIDILLGRQFEQTSVIENGELIQVLRSVGSTYQVKTGTVPDALLKRLASVVPANLGTEKCVESMVISPSHLSAAIVPKLFKTFNQSDRMIARFECLPKTSPYGLAYQAWVGERTYRGKFNLTTEELLWLIQFSTGLSEFNTQGPSSRAVTPVAW